MALLSISNLPYVVRNLVTIYRWSSKSKSGGEILLRSNPGSACVHCRVAEFCSKCATPIQGPSLAANYRDWSWDWCWSWNRESVSE